MLMRTPDRGDGAGVCGSPRAAATTLVAQAVSQPRRWLRLMLLMLPDLMFYMGR
jgi:hypothetical protein